MNYIKKFNSFTEKQSQRDCYIYSMDKTEINDYIKDLYLQPAPSGDHLYSFQNILDKCIQKYPKAKLSRSTIYRRVNKKDKYTNKSIQDLWDESKRSGATREIVASKTKELFSNEEKLKENLENKFYEMIQRNKILHEKAFKALTEMQYEAVDVRDLIVLFNVVSKNLENLLELKKSDADSGAPQAISIVFEGMEDE